MASSLRFLSREDVLMRCDRKTMAVAAIAGAALGTAIAVLVAKKMSKDRARLRLVSDKLEPLDEPINDYVPPQNEWVHSE